MTVLIDADSHLFPRDAMDAVKSVGFEPFVDARGREWCRTPSGAVREWGKMYYDVGIRLQAMKEAGFDKQVLICDQGFVPDFVPLETSRKVCRSFNESVSRMQERNDEFIGIADVPHQEVGSAIEEAERAIRELNLKGIRIYGSWSGKNIESEEWMPFFELVDRLDVPLFFHTHGTAGLGKFNPNLVGYERLTNLSNVKDPSGKMRPLFVLGNGVGSGLEAITMVAGLVFHGVLEKYRNIRIAMLECGVGLAPWIASRLEMLLDFNRAMQLQRADLYGSWTPLKKRPSEYVKEHFWWTIDNVHEAIVPSLIRDLHMGRRLLAQTDFPHPEGSLDVVKWIRELDIPQLDKDRILGGNAAELFKMG